MNYDIDYVMFYNMRWYRDSDPGLEHYGFADEMTIEVLLSKSPEVQTMYNFNVKNFAISSTNYRLEYIVFLILSLFSVIFCFTCLIFTKSNMFTISDDLKN